jgi:hypothetical protein
MSDTFVISLEKGGVTMRAVVIAGFNDYESDCGRTRRPIWIISSLAILFLLSSVLPASGTQPNAALTPNLSNAPNSAEFHAPASSPSSDFQFTPGILRDTQPHAAYAKRASQIGGASYAVTVSGTLAYMGVGPRLVILNVSNKAHPTLVGQSDVLGAFVRGVTVNGKYAYVANGVAGLHIFNIENPAHPFEVGFYDTTGRSLGVKVAGNYAFVADEGDGLVIINISDPAHPFQAGHYDTPGAAVALALSDHYAYIADSGAGLRIINIADVAHPTEAGFFYDDNGGRNTSTTIAVDVASHYAYIVTLEDDMWGGYTMLRVIYVGVPTEPLQVGSLESNSLFSGHVVVHGNYAYFSDSNVLSIVDVSNHQHPVAVGSLGMASHVAGLVVAGNYAYVTDDYASTRGLNIVDVSAPSAPTMVGQYHTMRIGGGVALLGNYVYTFGGNGFDVVDVSNPASPVQTGGSYRDGDYPAGFTGSAMANNYLYLTDWMSLKILDVSNPVSPTQVGSLPVFEAGSVAVAGNYAYVNGTDGLSVIDVSNPVSPTQVSLSIIPDWLSRDIFVVGEYVYVSEGTIALRVYDISNPISPTLAASYDDPGFSIRTVSGNYAYGGYGDRLYVIDVSDPLHPVMVGTYYPPGGVRGIAISGDYAYVTSGGIGIHIFDITDPTTLTEVSSYNTPGYAGGVAAAGNYIYVDDGEGGLLILRLRRAYYLPVVR